MLHRVILQPPKMERDHTNTALVPPWDTAAIVFMPTCHKAQLAHSSSGWIRS